MEKKELQDIAKQVADIVLKGSDAQLRSFQERVTAVEKELFGYARVAEQIKDAPEIVENRCKAALTYVASEIIKISKAIEECKDWAKDAQSTMEKSLAGKSSQIEAVVAYRLAIQAAIQSGASPESAAYEARCLVCGLNGQDTAKMPPAFKADEDEDEDDF